MIDINIDREHTESSRSSHAAASYASERPDPYRAATNLHPALAFLAAYGIAPNVLIQASVQAARAGVRPEAALLAHGFVSSDHYYRALARHLGLIFVEEAELGALASYPHSILSGVAPLAEQDGGPAWLMAPEGRRLDELLTLRRRGRLPRDRFAITTPAELTRMVLAQRGNVVAVQASHDLINRHGEAFSAISARGPKLIAGMALAAIALAAAWFTGGALWLMVSLAFSAFISAAICVRLFAAAASCDPPVNAGGWPLRDDELPSYTIIIALYREAVIASQLAAALGRIDYPAGRLDIKLVVEAEDQDTRHALEALALPARYQIIIAPEGAPRTKPRALNIALPLARGSLVCVFDAEDIPAALQLREAAQHFAGLPHHVACLQGRLAIDNSGDGWLARCFAIEYAALFDVINPGLSALTMPVPLGGTSNHFRTDVLRKIGGWDAWNVTEDIDLGLRLARFGYQTGALQATTYEEAPAELGPWMRQRRRWFKGWIQTLFVHMSRPAAAISGMGAWRAAVAALHVGGTLAGALLGPLFALLVLYDGIYGNLLNPASMLELAAGTFWCFAGLAGFASAFWPAFLGIQRRGLMELAPSFVLLPVYWCLMTIAAWWALADFIRNPFHWLKTEHGHAKARTRPEGTIAS